MTNKLFYIILIILLISACNQKKPAEVRDIDHKELKESLMQANKELIKTEDELIKEYITRYNWDMTETGTGLRYMIYQHGNGKRAIANQIATIEFEVSLMNGNICYSSKETGPKQFRIGQGGIESGLEEGILLLRKGDRVKIIIPSHLAYGLIGDNNKIPAKATLVYDVELISLN